MTSTLRKRMGVLFIARTSTTPAPVVVEERGRFADLVGGRDEAEVFALRHEEAGHAERGRADEEVRDAAEGEDGDGRRGPAADERPDERDEVTSDHKLLLCAQGAGRLRRAASRRSSSPAPPCS